MTRQQDPSTFYNKWFLGAFLAGCIAVALALGAVSLEARSASPKVTYDAISRTGGTNEVAVKVHYGQQQRQGYVATPYLAVETKGTTEIALPPTGATRVSGLTLAENGNAFLVVDDAGYLIFYRVDPSDTPNAHLQWCRIRSVDKHDELVSVGLEDTIADASMRTTSVIITSQNGGTVRSTVQVHNADTGDVTQMSRHHILNPQVGRIENELLISGQKPGGGIATASIPLLP